MNRGLKRFWVVVATATVLCVQTPLAGAAMVSTDQAIDQGVAEKDRARVQAFLDRADAREQLKALGVDDLVAKDRVAGLTDREVHALAQKLETLPAGGELNNRQIIAVVLIVILVLLLI
ncbi:MAG: PA2779 family protein [Gammaproteobacteria bacterium]